MLRTVKILVPIALVVAAIIIAAISKKGKIRIANQEAKAQREMEEKNKQHEKAMEAELQAHRLKQAALSGRLKRSNEKLRDVLKQLDQTMANNSLLEAMPPDDYMAFVNAPICHYIIQLVHEGMFKSKMDYLIYKGSALSREQILTLRETAEKHLPRFVFGIRKQFPKLTTSDIDYCYLFLLGLSEADISALMQRAYTTVCDRSRKICRIVGANGNLHQFLRNRLSI